MAWVGLLSHSISMLQGTWWVPRLEHTFGVIMPDHHLLSFMTTLSLPSMDEEDTPRRVFFFLY